MKQHTVKVNWSKTGKIESVDLTQNGVTETLKVSNKKTVLKDDKPIGKVKAEHTGKWYDNQYKIVFTNKK